jgi:acyl-CoA dehydrogenase
VTTALAPCLASSCRALSPFFDDEDRRLDDECARIVPANVDHLHGAEVGTRLGAMGLFAHIAPAVRVRSLCVVRERLAYVSPVADSVFAVQGLATHPLLLAADAKWRAVIDDAIAGKRIGGFALTEPEAGSDVGSMRSVARRDGDGWSIDGDKTFISNVGIADFFVVFANADPAAGKKGISAFFVAKDAPGLTLEAIETIDAHPLGRLTMRGCKAALVGDVGRGLRFALGTLDVFRTSVGAAANGLAMRALDEALAHVRRRVQFGKPLADFQLVQGALAEMVTDLDAARLLVARAAWAKGTANEQPSDVAMAKMFATEAAQRVIDRAVQLFGGLGVVRGVPVEALYRSVRALRIYEGTTEIQKLIIGGALAKGSGDS